MNYKEMVRDAMHGEHGEENIQRSIEYFSNMLEEMKESSPKEYWRVKRELSEVLFGSHYTEELAKHDVSQMCSTDREGIVHNGEYWTIDDIKEITKSYRFSAEVTEWDVYVGFNSLWHDLQKVLEDEQIAESAYAFFFADEDWCGKGKIWEYMQHAL